MFVRRTRQSASHATKYVLSVFGAFVMAAAALPAEALPPNVTLEPAVTFQDANLVRCQQRLTDALAQCIGLPICNSDNGICSGPPDDGSCAARAQVQYEKCLARPPRVRLVN